MKVLIAFAHFFNPVPSSDSVAAVYGSFDNKKFESRKSYVLKCMESYKTSFEKLGIDAELRVYGVNWATLVNVDIDLTEKIASSLHIPWAMIDHVYETSDEFDLILLTEDDLLVNPDTLRSLINIDKELEPRELIIPNRIENFQSREICVDMFAMPGWLATEKLVLSTRLRSPRNTHSAFLFFEAEKFKIAYRNRMSDIPVELNGLGYLESALANLLNEFIVYRALPTSTALTIEHLDSWLARGISRGWFSPSKILDFQADRELG